MSNRKKAALVLGASLSLALVATEVSAWTSSPLTPRTFVELDTVSEVAVQQLSSPGAGGPAVIIKGTAVGSSTVETWQAAMGEVAASACQRGATLLMARPGRFRLKLERSQFGPADGCTLVAN